MHMVPWLQIIDCDWLEHDCQIMVLIFRLRNCGDGHVTNIYKANQDQSSDLWTWHPKMHFCGQPCPSQGVSFSGSIQPSSLFFRMISGKFTITFHQSQTLNKHKPQSFASHLMFWWKMGRRQALLLQWSIATSSLQISSWRNWTMPALRSTSVWKQWILEVDPGT